MSELDVTEKQEGIAVIGMSGRFPQARNVEEFWRNLSEGRESITRFSVEEVLAELIPHEVVRRPNYVRARAILDDPDLFDASFFGMQPREAAVTDPQQRLLLECAWEALEEAGYDPRAYDDPVGVFVGVGFNHYLFNNLYSNPEVIKSVGSFQTVIGNDRDHCATLLSYKLDLRGPSFTVQTACSTSLVAVHLACQSLLNGECSMALAGGASVILPRKSGYLYQQGGIMSPDGHCRPFDARAAGTVGGSGAALLLLKPLHLALHDRDHIRAVIKGSAINNDGSLKVGYTAPSIDGQAAVIAEALAVSGLSPSDISYVEAHGTATPLGDPIEIAALLRAHGTVTAPCLLGSVKSNVGHLDAAAGAAGLIKTVLALEHELIPPTLHYERPNPEIEFGRFEVNAAAREWRRAEGRVRRAGVSSFGIGGTNAHLIVEEAPSREGAADEAGEQKREASGSWEVLVLSARTEAALGESRRRLAERLEAADAPALGDAAYTLQVGRRAFAQRAAVVCRDPLQAASALRGAEGGRIITGAQLQPGQEVVFIFPGQGAQFVNMGRELYEAGGAFRHFVDECAALARAGVEFDLSRLLYPEPGSEDEAERQLAETVVTQLAVFTVEYALAQQLMDWGIKPAAMLGHSLGEYVAACLSGVFNLQAAVELVAERGRLMQGLPRGSMLAVSLGAEELQRGITAVGNGSAERLWVAAVNAPHRSVAGGDNAAVAALEEHLASLHIRTQRLATSHAFHTGMVEPILSAYGAFFDRLPKGKLHTPYVSNVGGGWADADEVSTSRHWLRHMREPVQFSAGVKTLAAAGSWVWLEVGPGRALSRLVKYHLTTAQTPDKQEVLTTLGEGAGDDVERLLQCVAQLWCYGVAVDWSQVRSDGAPAERTGLTGIVTRAPTSGRTPRRVPLPTYPFERQSYWVQHTRRPNSVESERAPDDLPDRTGAVTFSAPPAPERRAEARREATRPAPDAALERRQLISAELKSVVSAASGVEPQALAADATFFDLGFDSLLLIQISQGIKDRFGVEIAFRLLIEEFSSVEALTRHLDEKLPADRFTPPPPEEPRREEPPAAKTQDLRSAFIEAQRQALPIVSAQGAGETAKADVIRDLSALMLQQLRVLQSAIAGEPPSPATPRAATPAHDATPDTPAATATAETRRNGLAAASSHATAEAAAFGPWRPVTRSAADGLTPAQQEYLSDFTARYTARTAGSKALTQAHRTVLADTRVSAGFRQLWKEMVYPIAGRRSEGARLWDVDGNEYIDVNMGFGVNLLGHAPSFVVEALQEQLRDGIHIGPQSPLAGEVAALVCELTGMERATFCNTGSEAVMAAIRLARTVTGRTRVALFAGSYHGISDEMLVRGHGSNGELQAVPAALGIPPHMAREVLVLPYDHPASLEILRTRMHELAAVLVEPVQSSRPEVQPRDFLRELRRLTKEGGAALIFDEMITGFRIHQGGAQAWFGVQADLAAYGKIVGGGMPIGVVAGRKTFMAAVDGGVWNYGDDSYPAANQTFFAGTFCKHPLAMAAARAVLTHLRERGPGLQAQLNERTADFAQAFGELCQRLRAPMRVSHFGSLFRFMMAKELTHANLFIFHLLAKNIFIGDRAGFLSTAHTDRDVRTILNAVEESVVELQRAGFFPPGPSNGGGRGRAPFNSDAATEYQPASEGVTLVPLTEAQTGLLALMQTGDDAARAYNECMTLRVSGELDLEALGKAFQSVVDRHEALRSVFNLEHGRQLIHAGLHVDVPVVDLSGLDDAGRERAARAFIAEQAARAFDLEKGPVVSLHVAKLGAQEHLLSLATHHIACDGLAFDYIVSELCACYAAARRGAPCDLPAPTQISEYVAWQAQNQNSEELSRARDYWLQQFSDRVPVVELPTDYPRPEVQTHSGRLERQAFDAALLNGLKQTAARQGCTMFNVLLSAYMLMIHWLSSQRDIVVGTPSAGQPLMGGRNLIGYCINTLPIRSRIRDDLPLEEYVKSVRRRVLNAYEHQNYSLYRLVKDLRLLRDPSRHPLVSVSFNMDRVGAKLQLDGLKMEIVDNPVVFSTFDLSWNVVETPEKLHVECTYNSDLFAPATSRGWVAVYEIILRAIVGPEPHTVKQLLGLLADATRRRRAAQGEAFRLSRQETLNRIKRRGGGQV